LFDNKKMNNTYYNKIIKVWDITNGQTYQQVFDKCKISPYSSTASNKFRRAWNDLEASGRIELIRKNSDKPWVYCLNQ